MMSYFYHRQLLRYRICVDTLGRKKYFFVLRLKMRHIFLAPRLEVKIFRVHDSQFDVNRIKEVVRGGGASSTPMAPMTSTKLYTISTQETMENGQMR